jgi:hypothetical protein
VNDDPVRIKDALAPLGRKLGLRSPAEAARVFSRWQEVVGVGIAEHARPSSLKGGVLRIVVESNVWATEITYLADEIKARANEVAGATVVSEVRVWTGKGSSENAKSAVSGPSETALRGASGAPGSDAGKTSPDSPEEALARAKNAWSEARFRSRERAFENQERPR